MVSRKRVYAIVLLIVGGALVGVLFLHFRHSDNVRKTSVSTEAHILYRGDVRIPISIADTEAERGIGLSGTASLPSGTGKFFIFETPGIYGFWMKDMNYSLDLVWIDEAMTVVGITPHVAPQSYPEVFYAPTEVRYVLEVNEGEAASLGLAVGTTLTR